MSFLEHLLPIPTPPLDIAVSDCLLGSEVRYDGSHKRSSMPHEQLAGLFNYRPICPEVGIGLGVPRDTIRLVGTPQNPAAISTATPPNDVTRALATYAANQQPAIAKTSGYIFMKNSPSCGVFRVRVYRSDTAPPEPGGRGIYAAAVMRTNPNLPVEESGRLFDPVLRENFVTRTFVHAHWTALRDRPMGAKNLIAFHSAYKYLVMAHNIRAYRRLGRMLANLTGDVTAIADQYFCELMIALAEPATRGGHANVLSHLQGYVKQDITSSARQELARLIDDYRRGEVPLLAPVALLKHHLGQNDAAYALEQFYLNPHPASAGLRREL